MCWNVESSHLLKVSLRLRTQSQLTRAPDIAPADMHSVDRMAAVLFKVKVLVVFLKPTLYWVMLLLLIFTAAFDQSSLSVHDVLW